MAETKPPYELMQLTWGENVRNARGDRSQTWLATAVNVDQTTISRIERGAYRLTPELMIGLAAALDQELSILFPYPRGYVEMEQARQAAARAKTEREAVA